MAVEVSPQRIVYDVELSLLQGIADGSRRGFVQEQHIHVFAHRGGDVVGVAVGKSPNRPLRHHSFQDQIPILAVIAHFPKGFHPDGMRIGGVESLVPIHGVGIIRIVYLIVSR